MASKVCGGKFGKDDYAREDMSLAPTATGDGCPTGLVAQKAAMREEHKRQLDEAAKQTAVERAALAEEWVNYATTHPPAGRRHGGG